MAGDRMAGGNGTQILKIWNLYIYMDYKERGKVFLFYLEFQFIYFSYQFSRF